MFIRIVYQSKIGRFSIAIIIFAGSNFMNRRINIIFFRIISATNINLINNRRKIANTFYLKRLTYNSII